MCFQVYFYTVFSCVFKCFQVCFQVYSTLTVSFILRRYSTHSKIGIILHSYLLVPMGRNFKGLSTSPFLAINAKEGENIKPKAKGLHHHNFKFFAIKL
jgi:hypothetical protein